MKNKYWCIILLIFFVTAFSFSQAENNTEDYSCSMQLSYSDGTKLPPAPIKLSDLQGKQLHLSVSNHTNKADRFMLLCFLNGNLTPYIINGTEERYMQFQIDAEGTREIDFLPLFGSEEIYAGSLFYVITVGQLNYVPKNALDYYELFSCSIPVIIDDPTLKKKSGNSDIMYWQHFPLSNMFIDDMYVYYQSENDYLLELGKSMVYGDAKTGYDLNIAAIGYNQDIALSLFVDNQPCYIGNNQSEIVYLSTNTLSSKTIHLELSEGIHSIYLVYMSLDCNRPGTWNTNKLSLIISD